MADMGGVVSNSMQTMLLGGSGGMPPPRKILNYRPSEIVSRAVLGQNSRRSVKLEVLHITLGHRREDLNV